MWLLILNTTLDSNATVNVDLSISSQVLTLFFSAFDLRVRVHLNGMFFLINLITAVLFFQGQVKIEVCQSGLNVGISYYIIYNYRFGLGGLDDSSSCAKSLSVGFIR